MIGTLKTFSQKILYGFGFGGGMGLAFENRDLFRINIKKTVKQYSDNQEKGIISNNTLNNKNNINI